VSAATSAFTHGTTLASRTYGRGPKVMLAFHGFGRNGTDFTVLEGPLGGLVTIHAFDLHFHGESPADPSRADQPFTTAEFTRYFTAFLDSIAAERAVLLGYSLGGRIALMLLEHMPHRIERAFLVAPDGLVSHPWYRAFAATALGRRLYKHFIDHPERFHAIIDALHALGIIGERMHRFLKGQTDSRAKRTLVRDVWLSYRLLEPDPVRAVMAAAQHHVPVDLVFGVLDRVIPLRQGKRLARRTQGRVGLHTLPVGHTLLIPELGALLRELMNEGRA
jgi:pimeloyl-ACP methyl ester carboxylesterase